MKEVREIKMESGNNYGNNTDTCSLSKKWRGEESRHDSIAISI